MCSHVLAVVLLRKNGSGVEAAPGGTDTTETPEPITQSEPHNAGLTPRRTRLFALLEGGGIDDSDKPPLDESSASPVPPPSTSLIVPEVTSLEWGSPQLPNWVKELRPHQVQAIAEIMEAYQNGAKVVWLDAPTGSGKTLIAECVRRLLRQRAVYICSSLSLQDQFKQDYGYAKVLKGRTNYPTMERPFPEYTAGDCTKDPSDKEAGCFWCDPVSDCPYESAKREALQSNLAVVNTSYFLTEANYIGNLSGRDFVIVDECDVLEREVMGFVEFNLTDRMLKGLGLDAPKKGSHRGTIAEWMEQSLTEAIKHASSGLPRNSTDIHVLRRKQSLTRLYQDVKRIAKEVTSDNWIRDNDAGPLVLKPIKVTGYGEDNLWKHGKKWLCMSATIISPDELSESLGLEHPWQVVRVPMTFPVENRRIYIAPVANMVAREKDTSYPIVNRAIFNIIDRHPNERTLIHSVSYDLTKSIAGGLSGSGRDILFYTSAAERARILRTFLDVPGAVLIAPSFDRGIDLKGDDCRVVIVPKIPFLSLGDKQVGARLKAQGGQQWYTVQAVRSLVQMTGRAVRSDDDWCVMYVLDKQFGMKIQRSGFLPKWWMEAMDRGFPTRELLK